MDDFSRLLEHYRTKSGLSQNKIALQTGVTASYISRLGKGDRQPPSREKVILLAEVLNLDPAETNGFLLAAGYAPDGAALLPTANPVLGSMADILQDDCVPEDEIDLLRRQMEQMKRRWNAEK